MVIGVDLDGVIYDFIHSLRAYALTAEHNNNYNNPHTTWNVWEDWKISREKFIEIFEGFVKHKRFGFGPEITNASKYLKLLKEDGHQINIITARYDGLDRFKGRIIQDTGVWLEKNNIPFDDLNFSVKKEVVLADVYIDDAPHNCENLHEKGLKVIGFDNGYLGDIKNHIESFTNWADIYTHISETKINEEK